MKITPAFVREAYNLLRQSIIHVEQDDIDFDEEELAGERDRAADAAQAAAAAGTDDVEMAGVETSDQPIDESYNESGVLSTQAVHGGIHALTSSPTRAGGSGAQLVGTPVPRPAAVPRRRAACHLRSWVHLHGDPSRHHIERYCLAHSPCESCPTYVTVATYLRQMVV